jgi:hypothetical protein
MKCPKCGSKTVKWAGGDNIVNVSGLLFTRVDFCRCQDCQHFAYEDRFEDDGDPGVDWFPFRCECGANAGGDCTGVCVEDEVK